MLQQVFKIVPVDSKLRLCQQVYVWFAQIILALLFVARLLHVANLYSCTVEIGPIILIFWHWFTVIFMYLFLVGKIKFGDTEKWWTSYSCDSRLHHRCDKQWTKISRIELNLTNRFHIAVRLFSSRSRRTSKCSKNKKVAHKVMSVNIAVVTADLGCQLLLYALDICHIQFFRCTVLRVYYLLAWR